VFHFGGTKTQELFLIKPDVAEEFCFVLFLSLLFPQCVESVGLSPVSGIKLRPVSMLLYHFVMPDSEVGVTPLLHLF
jgi:hypothetical protein